MLWTNQKLKIEKNSTFLHLDDFYFGQIQQAKYQKLKIDENHTFLHLDDYFMDTKNWKSMKIPLFEVLSDLLISDHSVCICQFQSVLYVNYFASFPNLTYIHFKMYHDEAFYSKIYHDDTFSIEVYHDEWWNNFAYEIDSVNDLYSSLKSASYFSQHL